MDRTYLPRISRRTWGTVIICVGIGLCLVAYGILARYDSRVGHAHSPENLFRLHVIAHSDAPADQHMKLLVRDAILQEMSRWKVPSGPDEMEQVLKENETALRRAALNTLEQAGVNHDVRVELGQFLFDERTAGGVVFPAGEYQAVRVIIGAGIGQNWWCVLFPPLCFVDESTEVPVNSIGNQESIGDQESKVDRGQPTQVQVRLKLWETISKSAYAEALRERILASTSNKSVDKQ